jgi:hypothetical protein
VLLQLPARADALNVAPSSIYLKATYEPSANPAWTGTPLTVTLQVRAGHADADHHRSGPAQRVLNGRPIRICNLACGRSDGGTATSHEHCATDTSVTHADRGSLKRNP